MADSRRAGMFKTCMWLGLLPLLMVGVALLLAVVGAHFLDPHVAITESMRRWPVNPERWHAHPSIVIWGGFASCVVLVLAGVVFWIKDRYWP